MFQLIFWLRGCAWAYSNLQINTDRQKEIITRITIFVFYDPIKGKLYFVLT